MAIFRRLDIIRTPPPCAMLIQVGVIWEIWLDFYSLCAVQKHFRPRGEILHVETKLGQISPSIGGILPYAPFFDVSGKRPGEFGIFEHILLYIWELCARDGRI